MAGWNPLGVGVSALGDVDTVVSVLWLADTPVDGDGLVLEGGTISATSAGVPGETFASKTFWVAFVWEALMGGRVEFIVCFACCALGLCWAVAGSAGIVASVLVAFRASVSVNALASMARWHRDEGGVGSAVGTVIITVVVAVLANGRANNAFTLAEDSRRIA